MKTFSQLTIDQQKAAVERATTDILTEICEGAITFNDTLNGDNLQERIDAAWAKADAMRTPWFVHEFIMDTCSDDIESMARCAAQDALYAEKGEHVTHGIA